MARESLFDESSPGWFRRHFNEDYLTIYAGRDASQAEDEVEGIVRELAVTPEDRVLDLCCGFGRHLSAFARRGIAAIGVDLSLPLLKLVEAEPPPERGGVERGGVERGGVERGGVERGIFERRVVCADMRSLPFPGGKGVFSVVASFFTSFGYFEDDAENLRSLREIERVLAPGGRIALDLLNRETAVAALEPRTRRRAGPFLLVEERRYDAARRRIEKAILLECPETGAERRYIESVRVFDPGEIEEMLRCAGLLPDRLLGDFAGRPYGPGTPRMIVLGTKPAAERRGEATE